MKLQVYLALLMILVLLTACSEPEKNSRKKLSEMGIEWSSDNFFRCIRQNNLEAISLFLTSGMSPNERNGDYSALLESCRRGYSEISFALIDAGADVNAKDGFGVSALMFAAICGSADVMQRMIERGVDVNAKDIDGRTALVEVMATENDIDFTIFESLIDAGANVNVRIQNMLTLLMLAADGNSDILRLLIQAGADVNASDEYGATALRRAKDNPENTQILLAAGAKK